jgi:hypothetical protein
MPTLALASFAWSDDSDEHGEEHLRLEWQEVRELLEEEEEDASEAESQGKGERGGGR